MLGPVTTPGKGQFMTPSVEPLSSVIVAMMYFGDIVFAVSGALAAARHRMDVLGIVLIGVITGIGGGSLRDILLGEPVWWVRNPHELILCSAVAFVVYFLQRFTIERQSLVVWADALGLAAFAVVGAHVAVMAGTSMVVAAFLGMVTACGGGVVRDLLTQTRPMILCGEIYATAALVGAAAFAVLSHYALTAELAGILAFVLAFAVRALAVLFGLQFGVSGEPRILVRRRP
jgi:uncharacterized membrane protein YeiH